MNLTVTVSGTPYEQGVMHGKALKGLIEKNIEAVLYKLEQDKVNVEEYTDFIDKNIKFMEEHYPCYAEEIKGISDGSGIDYDLILKLNIPAYFMTKYFSNECSMLLARNKATLDGSTYLIKNRDMSTMIEQAIIKRCFEDGNSIIEVNGAGTVTYPASGINSHKLAITTTGFWSQYVQPNLGDISSSHIFVNVSELLRECRTVAEVIENLKTYPRMNGLNIIAVDEKDAVVIETTKDDMFIQHDDGSGILYRSNHYTLTEELRNVNPPKGEYPSTYARHERMGELIGQYYGKIRFQDMFRIMSDHKNGINCLCRHETAEKPAKTVSTTLIVLEDLELWSTLDNPCISLPMESLK